MFEWYFDKLLCKRFNVFDFYLDLILVGLLRVKCDKYLVFNFLMFLEIVFLFII